MYYRYRRKQKNNKKYIVFFILIALGVSGYFLYKKRDIFLFWKYSYTRMNKQLIGLQNKTDKKNNIGELTKLQENSIQYVVENPLDYEAFYLLSKVNFNLAESLLGKTYAGHFLDNNQETVYIDSKVRKLLTNVVKYIRKAVALDKKSKPSDEILIILAKSLYYTDYNNSKDIYKVMKKIRKPESLKSVDNRRFYGIATILEEDKDRGIEFIEKYALEKGDDSKIFLAASYEVAKQYTKAIMEYKSQLATEVSTKKIKKINSNLAKIYFKQTLYKEALKHFNAAHQEDKEDDDIKLSLSKVFVKLRNYKQAKVYLNDILSRNKDHKEAKEILAKYRL